MMKNKQAYSLFLPRERKQLWGKNALNVYLLSGISLLAILSIGFASASMDYLAKTMRDPFVTCIDIEADQIFSRGYKSLHSFIVEDSVQDCFGFSHPEDVFYISENFYHADGRKRQLDGRTFSMNSPLKDGTILASNNVIGPEFVRKTPIKDSDFGVIIAQSGLDKLGMQSPAFLTQSVNVGVIDENGEKIRQTFTFSVPVLAIVKQLPNMCDFLVTESYASHELNEGADHFNLSAQRYHKNLTLCCLNEDESAIIKEVSSCLHLSNRDADFSNWSDDYMKLIFTSESECPASIYDSVFASLSQHFMIYRIYDFWGNVLASHRDPQIVSCYFEGNDSLQYKVEAFKNRLEMEDLNYKLDMSKINNLKNLAYIQQMGNTLSIGIILISIIFICVFIYLLLSNHFQKIQCNLGTFKAFGVDDSMLYMIYLRIMSELVLFSYCNAFVIAVLLQCAEMFILHVTWINVFAWQNYMLLGLAIILSGGATVMVARQLLKHSPGDLIYCRNQKK